MQILVIDDDERLGEMLVEYLRGHGFSVEQRLDGQSGITAVEHGRFDAVVLDVMLPDTDGFEVCKRLRALSDVPIVMLTARGDETDRIVGLELGADDYLPKPFNPRELLARVRAVLRRGRANERVDEGSVLRFDDLVIDRGARTVTRGGKPCDLTSYQFDLLRVLAERAGRVQSREQLTQLLRGERYEVEDRSIDVHVSRIRAAIEDDPKRPVRVRTVRAVGYVFTLPGDDAA